MPLLSSVAAGVTMDTLSAAFLPRQAIIRVMPNTPALAGEGMSVLCANEYSDRESRQLIEALMDAVGKVAWIADEALMDAVTAVSGSGPAYVFLLAECLTEAAVTAGLPSDLAAKLARQTVVGGGALLAQSDLAAATLRKNVTSPGGTTQAALEKLMDTDEGFGPLLERAVLAAKARFGYAGLIIVGPGLCRAAGASRRSHDREVKYPVMVTIKTQNAIIDGFMALLGETSLDTVTLPQVARRSGVSLGSLRGAFDGRMEILAAFSARIDKAVLDGVDKSIAEEDPRERLFDILFSRLEQLQNYKSAIAALARAARRDPLVALHLNALTCRSMAWMMAGAGIAYSGKGGTIRAQGLVSVWARVLRVWLADEDPGLARTMAALDRHLRGGERMMVRLGRLECLAKRICSGRLLRPSRRDGKQNAGTPGGAGDGAVPDGV